MVGLKLIHISKRGKWDLYLLSQYIIVARSLTNKNALFIWNFASTSRYMTNKTWDAF